MSKHLTVQAVATLSGVTIRTLHHYDEIGLLCPKRGKGGYRQYSQVDVLRLQQILVYRELGLPLQRIKAVMDDDDFDPAAALLEQKAQLQARAESTARLLAAVDQALARVRGETDSELAAIFDGFDPAAYADEARERWGHASAHAESARRAKGYCKDDLARIEEESTAILRRIAASIAAGETPESETGIAHAEAYRLHIDRYHYPCSRAMYREVASLYTSDERFQARLDSVGEGVAAFLAKAAAANAA